MFRDNLITLKGAILLGKHLAGQPIQFTRFKLGSGSLGTMDPESVTGVIKVEMDLAVSSVTAKADGKVYVGTTLTNAGLAAGFLHREIGLYANDPDVGEILYAYTYNDTPEFIPPSGSATILERDLNVVLSYIRTNNASITVSESLVFASKKEIEDLKEGVPVWGGTTTKTGSTYAISKAINSLKVGMAVSFKADADSTAPVIINWDNEGAYPMINARGTAVSNLKKDGIYTVRFGGSSFTLQGEGASGNALASDLRSGKTASTDAGEITGTLDLTNLTPSNLRKGVTAGGVSGTLDEGETVIKLPDSMLSYDAMNEGYLIIADGKDHIIYSPVTYDGQLSTSFKLFNKSNKTFSGINIPTSQFFAGLPLKITDACYVLESDLFVIATRGNDGSKFTTTLMSFNPYTQSFVGNRWTYEYDRYYRIQSPQPNKILLLPCQYVYSGNSFSADNAFRRLTVASNGDIGGEEVATGNSGVGVFPNANRGMVYGNYFVVKDYGNKNFLKVDLTTLAVTTITTTDNYYDAGASGRMVDYFFTKYGGKTEVRKISDFSMTKQSYELTPFFLALESIWRVFDKYDRSGSCAYIHKGTDGRTIGRIVEIKRLV